MFFWKKLEDGPKFMKSGDDVIVDIISGELVCVKSSFLTILLWAVLLFVT